MVVGLSFGVAGALIAAPVLFAGAFDTSPRDATIYVTVIAILLAVGLLASYLPIRRVVRVAEVELRDAV